jgi:hypothetical protein
LDIHKEFIDSPLKMKDLSEQKSHSNDTNTGEQISDMKQLQYGLKIKPTII